MANESNSALEIEVGKGLGARLKAWNARRKQERARRKLEKEKNKEPIKITRAKWWFIALLVVNLAIYVITVLREWPLYSIFFIGAVTFIAVLAISNYLSEDENLKTGEVRKAIAASMIMVYFIVLSWTFFGADWLPSSLSSEVVLDNFTRLIEVVVIFYFGSRAVEQAISTWPGRAKTFDSGQPGNPDPEEDVLAEAASRKFFDNLENTRGG